jgi:glyoxylase-like metal-dependent hydrolase (beta-lactamase superfamily II)
MEKLITQVPMGQANSYLISAGEGFILVDAGVEGKLDNLRAALEKLNAKLTDIKLIIITHVHIDHVGSLAAIKKKANAPVLVHQQGAKMLAEGTTNFPAGTVWWAKLISKLVNTFSNSTFKPVEADITIESNYDLDDFGIEGQVIHTPGHTADSISVIIEDKYILVGDTVFTSRPGDSIYPPLADDEEKLKETWQEITEYNCRQFFPGHGDKFSAEQFTSAVSKQVNL